jgi:hypothetical protein
MDWTTRDISFVHLPSSMVIISLAHHLIFSLTMLA